MKRFLMAVFIVASSLTATAEDGAQALANNRAKTLLNKRPAKAQAQRVNCMGQTPEVCLANMLNLYLASAPYTQAKIILQTSQYTYADLKTQQASVFLRYDKNPSFVLSDEQKIGKVGPAGNPASGYFYQSYGGIQLLNPADTAVVPVDSAFAFYSVYSSGGVYSTLSITQGSTGISCASWSGCVQTTN